MPQRSGRIVLLTLYTVLFAFLGRSAAADGPGDALLKRCVDAEARLQSLHAEFTQRIDSERATVFRSGEIALKKPNKGHISYREKPGEMHVILHSDGQTLYRYAPAENEYTKSSIDPAGGNFGNLFAKIFFYADTLNQFRAQGVGAKILGSLLVGGTACKLLKILGSPPGTSYQFYIGPDGLLRGMKFESAAAGPKFSEEHRYIKVRTDAGALALAMAWKIPKGARLHPAPSGDPASPDPGDTASQTQQELLKVGSKAPDFKLPAIGGGKLSLSSFYRGKRVILLNFWNASSDPGVEELSHLGALISDLAGKGFDVLTIDSGDALEPIRKLWLAKKLSLHGVWKGDTVIEQYHVLAIPTNYLIDGKGKIIAHF